MTEDEVTTVLGAVAQADHPRHYCDRCLGERLGVEEAKIRRAAQMLVSRKPDAYALKRRPCAACGDADRNLTCTRAGALIRAAHAPEKGNPLGAAADRRASALAADDAS